MSELFRQFAADSARIRPYPRGVRRCPPNVRRTFGGVRRKIFLADVWRIRAEPGGVRAFPRGFGRNRGGRSSAEPIAETEAIVNKDFCIATLEQDVWINHPNSGKAFKSNSPQRKTEIDWDRMCDHNLGVNKKKQLIELLEKHKGIFHTGGKLPIVKVGVEHTMNILSGAPPTVCRPRRLS